MIHQNDKYVRNLGRKKSVNLISVYSLLFKEIIMPNTHFGLAASQMGFQSGLVWLGGVFAVIFIVIIGGSRIPLLRRWISLSK